MSGHPFVVALALALASGVALAQDDGDPMHSADCRQAMDALQTQEAKLDAAARSDESVRHAALTELAASRRDAARICLGGHADLPPQRTAQPPLAVSPIVIAPPAPVPAARPTALPPLPLPAAPTTANCDAAGCWASDGTRLRRVGPNLLGPRGFCTLQGAILHCP